MSDKITADINQGFEIEFETKQGIKGTVRVKNYKGLVEELILRLKEHSGKVNEGEDNKGLTQEDLFSITYEDEDGDKIMISCDEDFEEAIRYFQDEGTKVKLLIKEKIISSVEIHEISHLISKEKLDELDKKDIGRIEINSEEKIHDQNNLNMSEIIPDKKITQGPTLTESCFDEVSDLTSQLTPPQPEETKVPQVIPTPSNIAKPTENPPKPSPTPPNPLKKAPVDYKEEEKMDSLPEPQLTQRTSSYNSYCESYLDTINELTDVMQGLGVEFDKLADNIEADEGNKKEKEGKEEVKVEVDEEEVEKRRSSISERQPLIPKSSEDFEFEETKLKENPLDSVQPELKMEIFKAPEDIEAEKKKEEAILKELQENSRKKEILALKNREKDLHKNSIHKEIKYDASGNRMASALPLQCNICNADIRGVRYFCIQCDNYNLCYNCESLVLHEHPMMKLRTSEDIVNFAKCLKNKLGDQEENIEERKEELDFWEQLDEADVKPANSEEYDLYVKESEKFSDGILKQLKAVQVQMSPKCGHVITAISSDICLTVTLKNTGINSWPKGFKIWSDQAENMGKLSIESKLNCVKIGPGEEIMLDVTIQNPKIIGKYYYIFYLVDAEGRRFGDSFEFYFTVKNSFSNYPQKPFEFNHFDVKKPVYQERSAFDDSIEDEAVKDDAYYEKYFG